MLLMMGVDSVESRSSTKAMKNSIDKGVAGRNMTATKDKAVYHVNAIRCARDRLLRLGVVIVVLSDRRQP
jgi:hypothetical protein